MIEAARKNCVFRRVPGERCDNGVVKRPHRCVRCWQRAVWSPFEAWQIHRECIGRRLPWWLFGEWTAKALAALGLETPKGCGCRRRRHQLNQAGLIANAWWRRTPAFRAVRFVRQACQRFSREKTAATIPGSLPPDPRGAPQTPRPGDTPHLVAGPQSIQESSWRR